MILENLDFEKKRKTFHASSIILPILYLYISKLYMIIFLLIIALITLYLDTSRHYNPKVKKFIDQFFTKIIRDSEKSGTFRLSGASFMIVGFLLSSLLFPKGLAIASWLILIIADPIASLVGIKIGTYKFGGKTLEGSVAFLCSAIFISILSYYFIGFNTSFITIILSCFVATLTELYSKKIGINDNFLIPISFGISNVIFNFLF